MMMVQRHDVIGEFESVIDAICHIRTLMDSHYQMVIHEVENTGWIEFDSASHGEECRVEFDFAPNYPDDEYFYWTKSFKIYSEEKLIISFNKSNYYDKLI